MKLSLPLRTKSTANLREHHMARHRRVKAQRAAVHLALLAHRAELAALRFPLEVTLIRVGPRRMDSDNAVIALKSVRDEIAAFLSVDDGDARIAWVYGQERGAHAVSIEVREVAQASGLLRILP